MWEIMGGLLLGTALSGILPVVNAELLVAATAAAVHGVGVPLVVGVSTLGQMTTKTLLFSLARWAPARLPKRAQAALERAGAAVSAREAAVTPLIFTSAALGLPPFYGVSLACGALEVRLWTFLVAGGAGRALRFGALAWAARWVGDHATSPLAERVMAFLGG
jgi:membrane protein YqaA with SNARE-associated domain